MADIFLFLFLTLFFSKFFLERFLAVLNANYVAAHREVPEIVKESITPEGHTQSIDYTLVRTRFGHLESVMSSSILLILLFSGILPWLDHQLAGFKMGELGHGVALIIAVVLIKSWIDLPLEWYQTFHIEGRFGFNQTTGKTFWLDQLKSLLLLLLIGVPFLFGLLFFMTRTGQWWWVWAALFVIGFQLFMMILYPTLIAPFFNKFVPLEEGELKNDVDNLAAKCHFATKGIYVMDASKRSKHSNAYFTGIGKSRRIVFFDTLLQQLSPTEIVAVLAHEIGHYKKKHITKMLFLSSLMTLMGFYVLHLLIDWQPMYQAFGIQQTSIPIGLLIFSFIGGAMTFWIHPLFNLLSRRHEYEADAYAVKQTGNRRAMETALIKLFKENLAVLTPHPAYSRYHYSHPTLIERIKKLRNVQETEKTQSSEIAVQDSTF